MTEGIQGSRPLSKMPPNAINSGKRARIEKISAPAAQSLEPITKEIDWVQCDLCLRWWHFVYAGI